MRSGPTFKLGCVHASLAHRARSISYWRMRSARSLYEAFSADWNMGRLREGAKA
jgi:hypothetical protein